MSRESQPTVATQPPEAFDVTTPVPIAPGTKVRAPSIAPPSIAPGTKVGRYVIGDPLGSGGMSVVYAARDTELGRDVALKFLRSELEREDPEAANRIMREARAMARIAHPNVVAVFEAGTVDRQVFIAMERVSGTDLRAWLAAAPRSTAEILEVFAAAGLGLIAAHDAGMLHGDFKPDNVLVGTDGRARVTDFGLADDADGPPPTTDSERAHRPFAGTPSYMPPEQHAGGHLDARSDQFSFAVALFEALYGKRPFTGSTYRQLADAILDGKVAAAPPGARVPASLRAIVLRALSVRPGDRYPTMAELLRALGRDRGRRPRQVARGATVAFALVAVAFGGDWVMRDRARAVTNESFKAAKTQLEKLIQLRADAFSGQSEALFRIPVMQEIVGSRDMADFGLGDEAEDRQRLGTIHDTLQSADWVNLTRTHTGDVIAIADAKGRLLFDSQTTAWGTPVTAVPAIEAAYTGTADTSIGVLDAADPKVTASGLVRPDKKLYVVFGSARRIGGQVRGMFVQLFEASRMLDEVGVGDDVHLSVITVDGTVAGDVPAAVVAAPTGIGVEEVEIDGTHWLIERAPLRTRQQSTAIAQIVLARTADVGLAGLRFALGALLAVFASLAIGGFALARARDLSTRSPGSAR